MSNVSYREAYQRGAASRDEEVEQLRKENREQLARYSNLYHDYKECCKERNGLATHVERLRKVADMAGMQDLYVDYAFKAEVLAETPTKSLQALADRLCTEPSLVQHDNEVIDRCAEKCSVRVRGIDEWCRGYNKAATALGNDIRALKHVLKDTGE